MFSKLVTARGQWGTCTKNAWLSGLEQKMKKMGEFAAKFVVFHSNIQWCRCEG